MIFFRELTCQVGPGRFPDIMQQGYTGPQLYLPPITDNVLRLILVLIAAFFLESIAATFFYASGPLSGQSGLMAAHALFYGGSGYGDGFHPAQLITHVLLVPTGFGGLLPLLFNGLLLYFFGSELERQWGSHHFLRFVLYTTLGGIVAALLARLIPDVVQRGFAGQEAPLTAIMVSYAMLWPERKILLFFFIPIKVRYAVFGGLLIYALISVFSGQLEVLIQMSGGALAGTLFLYYYARRGTKAAEQDYYSSRSSSAPGSRLTQKKEPDWNERWNDFKKKRRLKNKQAEIDRRIEMKNEVDRLLEKISKEGMDSLSRKEKVFLDKASKEF